MPISPADFLNAAKRLRAPAAACECDLRSATSRAYYAAYHHCLTWLGSLPPPARTLGTSGGVHQRLIDRLQKPHSSLIPLGKHVMSRKAAQKLVAMRIRRKYADYELGITPTRTDTENQIAAAESILRDVT